MERISKIPARILRSFNLYTYICGDFLNDGKKFRVQTMVLILDGNSEHVAHACRKKVFS